MKNSKLMMMFLAGILLVGFSSQVLAFEPSPGAPGRRGPSPEKMVEKLAKDIGLTSEQKDKFLEEGKKLEEQAKQIRAKNKDLFDSIEKELQKNAPDSKVIYGYMQQISQNDLQIRFKRMEQIIAMKKELTPEQKARLDKLMKDRQEKGFRFFKKKHNKK